jgi:hydrogenase-1 operon protein HyaF
MFPPAGFGPGSQPTEDDGRELNYVPMPSGMRTFASHVPYLETVGEAAGAVHFLQGLAEAAQGWTPAAGVLRFELDGIDARSRAIVADTLGEGEVAVVIAGPARVDVQESVFAGVWRVASRGREHIEIGAVPAALLQPLAIARPAPDMPGPGVVNAPAILTEILDHARNRASGADKHVVNLTLLPHTPEDLAYLDQALGSGGVTVLSRGYGNCRVERTAWPDIWRVRYYNSQDALILDTIEVTDVPEVVQAAPEDIADSAERLAEVAGALS